MQSLVNLYNQALSAIGSGATVTNPETKSASTDILNLWYPVARRAVFSSGYWTSVRTMKLLGRVGMRDKTAAWTNGAPAPGYLYSYGLPTDLVQPQYMEDFSQFRLGRVGESRVLFSNSTSPILNYTMDDDNPGHWEPDLYRCVVWALAACINMAKSGKMALTQKLEQQVQGMIEASSVDGANAEDQYFDAIPSFYAGTGFSIPHQSPRFFYPVNTFRVEGLTP